MAGEILKTGSGKVPMRGRRGGRLPDEAFDNRSLAIRAQACLPEIAAALPECGLARVPERLHRSTYGSSLVRLPQ